MPWLNKIENGRYVSVKLTLDSFCNLGQFLGGKCKIIGGFWELWELAFRMYAACLLLLTGDKLLCTVCNAMQCNAHCQPFAEG